MYRIVCETGSALRSTSPSPFTLTVTLRVSKNQVQVRDRRSAQRQNEASQEEGPEDHGAYYAVSGSCVVQRLRSFIDSLLKADPGSTQGPVGVSVLTIIFIYTSTTLRARKGKNVTEREKARNVTGPKNETGGGGERKRVPDTPHPHPIFMDD